MRTLLKKLLEILDGTPASYWERRRGVGKALLN